MKGILSFNLLDQYEREEFRQAQKGSFYEMQINSLYSEVFRPHFKHGIAFIDLSTNPVKVKTYDDMGKETEVLVDSKIAEAVHDAVVEIVWSKVHEHFNKEE